jgi:tetratricopeptide (TPR) repeat protein
VKLKKTGSFDPSEVKALLSDWTIVADQGQSSAQFMVGVLFMKGDLIPQDWSVAETWFRKADKLANSWVNLGLILKHRGELDASVDANEKAIVLDPKNVPAYYNLGLCRLVQGKEMDVQAMACFRKAVEIDPKHKDAFYNIGRLLLHRSCLMGATAMFELVLKLDPGHEKASASLAHCLLLDNAESK